MADVTSPAVNNVLDGIRDLFENQFVESVMNRKTKFWFEEAMKTVKVAKEQEVTVDSIGLTAHQSQR